MEDIGFIKTKSQKMMDDATILVPPLFTHAIAFGQTGCGKTTSFIYPNIKHRLELGHGILIYDYKGKEHLSVKALAKQTNRLDDVVEIGKPWGESINLIQNMGEEAIDNFFDYILHHDASQQFWQNSAKSLGHSILKILKAIESFATVLGSIDKDFENNEEYIFREFGKYTSFKYPIKRTLASLLHVCSTSDTLNNFIKDLDELSRITDMFIKENIEKILVEVAEGDMNSSKKIISQLICAREYLMDVIEENRDTLKTFGKDSNENLTQNVIGSLTSPLSILAQNKFYNTNSFDVVSALNQGKIIIVNTQALSDVATESFNSSILYELTKRTQKINIHPISIFIDESQRILSKETDLPVDILREAKVDVFLSTQNSALLKDKLGLDKFTALMGNLTHKYYFQTSTDEELQTEFILEEFKTFEYIASQNSFLKQQISQPLYLSLQEKIDTEYLFQTKHNILYNYAYEFHKKPYIVEYISSLYKEKKLLLRDIKTYKERIIDSMDLEFIRRIDLQVNYLFDIIEQEIDDAIQMEREYDMEDDYNQLVS